ncbi:hypothetical protein F6A46_09420 [Tenacibaculum finnmarkense genomovar ulcerans]|uniref:DUF6712 family protein n=1 Tax=Tenacibaculum finnmarkense TaxID=2781243 RepID=UPI00187B53FC|nr:DUF6712 family protein [Tenacibaculum finnmarkense]MBE7688454.1 hypothetical protein [Tenacibaculum finnmarkense genomovar ulcerans]
MIVQTTDQLREHISVNGSVNIENLSPYLRKATRNFLKPLIGTAQIAVFEQTQTDPILIEAQVLAREVVANFGYYLYLPIGAVQASDAGFFVVDSENTKQASDKQFKELQRSFKKSGHEALDDLLDYMEQSADKFLDWFNSDYYTVYKELLVNKTSIFNKWYYIFNSRQTFVAMMPTIRIVEDQFIKPVIGSELLDDLKSNQTIQERKEVKEYLQQAIVAFTVMKTVDNGMFILDARGMHMKFDVLPYEKSVTNVNLKVNDFLVRTKRNKKVAGEEYLKIAKEIILKNPTLFPEFKIKPVRNNLKITVTKGIVGF